MMDKLQWTEAMSVGVPGLDADHRQLIHILGELQDEVAAASGAGALRLLEGLADYAKGHFAREEAFLASLGYPDFVAHQAAHEAMIKDVIEALMDQADSPDPELSAKLYGFVKNWLLSHILQEDMAYARFVER